jgi:hypothetical protein
VVVVVGIAETEPTNIFDDVKKEESSENWLVFFRLAF